MVRRKLGREKRRMGGNIALSNLKGVKMSKMKNQDSKDPIQKELSDIKRLLVLLLLKINTEGKEIAVALGVNAGTVSRMIPKSEVKTLKF